MTTTALRRQPMSLALRDALAHTIGFPCELRSIPRVRDGAATVSAAPPYVILYPLDGGSSGTQGKPHSSAAWSYQATLVGQRGDQLELLYDRLVAFLYDRHASGAWVHPLAVEGQKVYDRNKDDENGAGASGEDTKAGIMSHDVRFTLSVSPA
ncbi:hypothetical protein [Aeromicrobium sp. Leaf291]|uniref:hypothetical protein n=1 Tax=Aeromicrobium sp. Leaf291 TaxID=1736325 RepID=UPI0007015208|nr:hypothetical protein [Aeromicrobium sp. Leaf291]KQP81573.1 hypothetical protein ASF35_16210 [Aeromicrobium sp. Leaf291]